jgi:hypothetical protein
MIGSQLRGETLSVRLWIEDHLTKTSAVNGQGSCRWTKGVNAGAKVQNPLCRNPLLAGKGVHITTVRTLRQLV